MKKLVLASTLIGTLFLASCTAVQTPLTGILYTDVTSGNSVTSNSLGSKVGRASASAILGVSTGDVSIQTAANSAGIKKISHIDQKSMSVLGIYSTYEIIVYGE